MKKLHQGAKFSLKGMKAAKEAEAARQREAEIVEFAVDSIALLVDTCIADKAEADRREAEIVAFCEQQARALVKLCLVEKAEADRREAEVVAFATARARRLGQQLIEEREAEMTRHAALSLQRLLTTTYEVKAEEDRREAEIVAFGLERSAAWMEACFADKAAEDMMFETNRAVNYATSDLAFEMLDAAFTHTAQIRAEEYEARLSEALELIAAEALLMVADEETDGVAYDCLLEEAEREEREAVAALRSASLVSHLTLLSSKTSIETAQRLEAELTTLNASASQIDTLTSHDFGLALWIWPSILLQVRYGGEGDAADGQDSAAAGRSERGVVEYRHAGGAENRFTDFHGQL